MHIDSDVITIPPTYVAKKINKIVLQYALFVLLMWLVVLGGSLAWNISNEHQQSYELALQAARTSFNKDQAFRFWGTKHGGVYVPPTKDTPPNPYLAHLPHRDVETLSGKKLTLMNPAYMVNQMMDDYADLYGITGRIVGLVALNPKNIADEWESNAIKKFMANEAEEVIELSLLNGVPHLRLIRPMIMKEGCQKCHGHLGFKNGEVRGGVGVSLPMTPYLELGEAGVNTLIISHLIIFMLGLTGIAVFSFKAKQYLLERQQVNLTLQRNVEDLQELEKLKDEFLANTSHELRTPLNGIIGIVESMLAGSTGEINPTQRENLILVASSGRRLFNLVNDVLDFSKLRHSDIEIKNNVVDMKALIDVVVQLSQHLVANKPLKLLSILPDKVALIVGDEDRIQQILFNLIGNAIKFTRSGTVEVSIKQQKSTEKNQQERWLEITVSDTGIGIAPENLVQIFESFQQADGAIAREFGGTGLGLSISKKLAELHGGHLTVRSKLQQGSKFTLSLPITSDISEVNSADSHVVSYLMADSTVVKPQEITSQANVVLSDDIKATILAVDDEPINLQVIENQLGMYNYRVLRANSGAEALELLSGEKPDLILLDLMMPQMSGFEVCHEIRKQYSIETLPIILLTAKNQVSDLVQGFESGANDFISKPFSQSELRSRINTHLQLKKETDLKLEREATIRKMNEDLEQTIFQRTEELQQSLINLKAAQKQMIESEKMSALGHLVAGVAHEINTPLGVSVTAASFLHDSSKQMAETFNSKKITRRALSEYFEQTIISTTTILFNLERAATQVSSFKKIAVDQSSQNLRVIDVKHYLNEIILSLHPEYKKLMTEITLQCEEGLKMTTYPGSLVQVITNLVMNSLKHAFENKDLKQTPAISINIYKSVQDEIDFIYIEFKDNGQGIKKSQLARIFEPFYTTKRNQGGSGLGLSIVYNLVTQQLGGEISCHSNYGEGTTFSFSLKDMAEKS